MRSDPNANATANATAPAAAAAGSSRRRSVMSLGLVSMLDMLIQVILPMILVRALTGMDFGEYRLLWLLVATAVAVLPMAVPNSLFYFLPRSGAALRSAYLVQAALFMIGAAVVAMIGTWLWGTVSSHHPSQLNQVTAFVGMWFFASLLDVLFIAQQQGSSQAAINLTFTLLRLVLVTGSALISHSIAGVMIAHLLLGAAKAIVCAAVIWRQAAATGLREMSAARSREQLGFAAPFGASSGLYLLRGRIDQWLVAALFSAAQFGLYSVAAVFSPIQGLIRSTINNVVLPELSQLQAGDKHESMVALNQRGNLAVALIMFPTLTFLFAMAPQLLTILFTAEFAAAAPVVRTYCVMLLIESIEVTTLLTAYRQGPFLMRLDALLLLISVTVSLIGARWFGMPGAAAGAAVGALLSQIAAFRRCAALTKHAVTQQQDWISLLRILLIATIAALATTAIVATIAAHSPWFQLLISVVVFCALYWLALRVVGLKPVVRNVFGSKLARWAAL